MRLVSIDEAGRDGTLMRWQRVWGAAAKSNGAKMPDLEMTMMMTTTMMGGTRVV